MTDWVKVTEVSSWQEAHKIANFLHNHEIVTNSIDKTDSSYGGIFGKIEIYCESSQLVEAIHLINKNKI
jgi:hypothetical protein